MKITYITYSQDVALRIQNAEFFEAFRRLVPEVKEFHLHPDFRNPLTENSERPPVNGPPVRRKRNLISKLFWGGKSAALWQLGMLLRNLRSLPKELRIISREKPDLLLVHKSFVVSPLLIAKLKKIPFVWQLDSPLFEKEEFSERKILFPSFLNFLEVKTNQWADALTAMSSSAKDHFVKKGVPAEKIFVAPNGANPEKFSPEVSSKRVREKFGLEGKLVIGFSGGFSIWHGIDSLLESVPTLVDYHPDVRFMLVGGPESGAYADKIKPPYADKVIFTGRVSYREVPEYLAAMDILVAPYPPIQFFYFSPLKIFEYMAMAKPVVAPRQGQLAELITDGENGFLYEPGNRTEMLDKIKKLLSDGGLRKRLGEKARKTIVENYTWSDNAQKALDACRYALSKHRTDLD